MTDVSLRGYFWGFERYYVWTITSSKQVQMMKANCYWRLHRPRFFIGFPCFWEAFRGLSSVSKTWSILVHPKPCEDLWPPLRSSCSWRLYDVAKFQWLYGPLGADFLLAQKTRKIPSIFWFTFFGGGFSCSSEKISVLVSHIFYYFHPENWGRFSIWLVFFI